MENIELLELSYSRWKLTTRPGFFFIFCVMIFVSFSCDSIELSQQETKNILIFVTVFFSAIWFASLFLICYRHSVTFGENGITIKDGKNKYQLLWSDIIRIDYIKEGFKCLEIETITDSKQKIIHYIPIQLLTTKLKEKEEEILSKLDDIISKFNSGYFTLEKTENKQLIEYKKNIKSESYMLQRKSNIPIALIFSTLIVGFFLIFPMKMAFWFSVVYLLILLCTINYSKDDLVFDAAGITIYHKHEISFISWENINNIEFIRGEKDTLIFYYKDDNNKNKSKTWYVSSPANVNGDIYDYFVNVSSLRGKRAIDEYKLIR